MKNLILSTILVFFTMSVFSQTQLDHLLFDKCNEYRRQNDIKEWTWSNKAFVPAEHHSKYQAKTGDMGHKENTITPSPTSRLDYYDVVWTYSGENCAAMLKTGLTNEEIANKILDMWKDSKIHNDLLLRRDGDLGAISCRIGRNYKWSIDEYAWVFCTLTVFKGYSESFVIE